MVHCQFNTQLNTQFKYLIFNTQFIFKYLLNYKWKCLFGYLLELVFRKCQHIAFGLYISYPSFIGNSSPLLFFFPVIYLLRKLGHLSYGIFIFRICFIFSYPCPISSWVVDVSQFFLDAPCLLGICDLCCKYLCPVCHLPFYILHISFCCENV